jgi:hypothetical protein
MGWKDTQRAPKNAWFKALAVVISTRALMSAIEFLEKFFVGRGDEERLIATISELKQEVAKRNKK